MFAVIAIFKKFHHWQQVLLGYTHPTQSSSAVGPKQNGPLFVWLNPSKSQTSPRAPLVGFCQGTLPQILCLSLDSWVPGAANVRACLAGYVQS